jgi:hypothetical protein
MNGVLSNDEAECGLNPISEDLGKYISSQCILLNANKANIHIF